MKVRFSTVVELQDSAYKKGTKYLQLLVGEVIN